MQSFSNNQIIFVMINDNIAPIPYRVPYEADFFLQLRKNFFAATPIYFLSCKNSMRQHFRQKQAYKDLLLFCLLFHLHFDLTTVTSYTSGTNFVNGASTSNEYVYGNNDNLTKDLNKNISNIQYNSLNLDKIGCASEMLK